MVGYSLGLFGICTIVTQGAFIDQLVRRYGGQRGLYLGLTATIAGFLGFAFAPSGWVLVVLILPACMGFMSASLLSSLLSTQVPPNMQGTLQGVVASLRSLAAIILADDAAVVHKVLVEGLLYISTRRPLRSRCSTHGPWFVAGESIDAGGTASGFLARTKRLPGIVEADGAR
jgi:MFS family permease